MNKKNSWESPSRHALESTHSQLSKKSESLIINPNRTNTLLLLLSHTALIFVRSHICTIWYSALRHTSLAFKSMYLKDTGLTEIILLEFHAVCLVPSPHSCVLLINADGIPWFSLMETLSHLHVNVCSSSSQNKWLMGASWGLHLNERPQRTVDDPQCTIIIVWGPDFDKHKHLKKVTRYD